MDQMSLIVTCLLFYPLYLLLCYKNQRDNLIVTQLEVGRCAVTEAASCSRSGDLRSILSFAPIC